MISSVTAEMQAKQKAALRRDGQGVGTGQRRGFGEVRIPPTRRRRNRAQREAGEGYCVRGRDVETELNAAKTVEERDAIIKAHAALRNRAVGFSVLKHENVSLKAKVAELEKAIAEFQASEPTGGGPKSEQNGEHGGGDEMANAFGRMSNYVT